MMPDRARIERLVPHAGAMCLLDAVAQWDDSGITCTCAGPTTAHPLAREGVVPAIAAAEYAAQAAAVHGGLLESAVSPRAGLLAKLVEVELHRPGFPAGGGAVRVRADMLSRSAGACLYAFHVEGTHQPIASGRLMVAFTEAAA